MGPFLVWPKKHISTTHVYAIRNIKHDHKQYNDMLQCGISKSRPNVCTSCSKIMTSRFSTSLDAMTKICSGKECKILRNIQCGRNMPSPYKGLPNCVYKDKGPLKKGTFSIWTKCARIGEARKPGPALLAQPKQTINIDIINISHLLNNADLINDRKTDFYFVTEHSLRPDQYHDARVKFGKKAKMDFTKTDATHTPNRWGWYHPKKYAANN